MKKRELDSAEKPKSQLIHVFNELIRNKAGLVSIIFLILMIGSSILAPILTSYDPVEINAYNTLKGPDSTHYFGTDDTGRDIFSRVLWGGRISLRVGIISAGISTIAGLILGLISGYFGGAVSFVILRFMDLLLAFPGVLLALFIVATLGPSLDNEPNRLFVFFASMLGAYFLMDLFKILLAKQLKRKLTIERIHWVKRGLGVVLMICGIVLIVKGFLPKDQFNIEEGIERIELGHFN